MAASYIKTSKSSANFANVLEEPMKTYKWLLLFHEHFLCLDNQCTASDVAPCTREIRILGPSSISLPRFLDNLRKSL